MWDFFYFANLARKGWINFGAGKIKVANARVLMMDVNTLNGFEEELEKIFGYKTAGQFIYRVAKEGGRRATRLHQRFTGDKGDVLRDHMEKMATGAGWGKIKIQKKFADGGIVVVDDSPFVKRKKGVPTCHFLRGSFAGSNEYVFGRTSECIEFECKSAGAKHCTFVVSTRKFNKIKNLQHLLYQIEKIGPDIELQRRTDVQAADI